MKENPLTVTLLEEIKNALLEISLQLKPPAGQEKAEAEKEIWLDLTETLEALQISRSTLYRKKKEGKIKVRTVAGRAFFHFEELDQALWSCIQKGRGSRERS